MATPLYSLLLPNGRDARAEKVGKTGVAHRSIYHPLIKFVIHIIGTGAGGDTEWRYPSECQRLQGRWPLPVLSQGGDPSQAGKNRAAQERVRKGHEPRQQSQGFFGIKSGVVGSVARPLPQLR